jgi:hypothetical protein
VCKHIRAVRVTLKRELGLDGSFLPRPHMRGTDCRRRGSRGRNESGPALWDLGQAEASGAFLAAVLGLHRRRTVGASASSSLVRGTHTLATGLRRRGGQGREVCAHVLPWDNGHLLRAPQQRPNVAVLIGPPL